MFVAHYIVIYRKYEILMMLLQLNYDVQSESKQKIL